MSTRDYGKYARGARYYTRNKVASGLLDIKSKHGRCCKVKMYYQAWRVILTEEDQAVRV